MFDEWNKQTGNEAQEANWEGWSPPWMHEGPESRGPFGPGRRFGGPRGWQGPWGPRHGFGGWHGPRGPFGPGFGPGRHWDIPAELLALRTEAAEVARLFAIASRSAFEDKERLSQLRALLDRSHKELSDMIYGSAQGQASGEKESASGTSNVGQA